MSPHRGGFSSPAEVPVPDPLTLNCRDAADAQQQRYFQRLTALAQALHDDHHPAYLTAAQPAPNARPGSSAPGSADAAELETLAASLEPRHWRHRRAVNVGSAADIERTSRDLDELERRIERVQAQLAALPTGRGHPCPNPHLYRVRTPVTELLIRGEVFEVRMGEAWTLDTHALPEALRARLTAYLLSGARAVPYKYKAGRRRYWPNSHATDDTRALMAALLALCTPAR